MPLPEGFVLDNDTTTSSVKPPAGFVLDQEEPGFLGKVVRFAKDVGKGVVSEAVGLGENIANQGSTLGAFALAVPNIIGSTASELANSVVEERMPSLKNIGDTFNSNIEAMTYKPVTASGQRQAEASGKLLKAIPDTVDAIDEATGDKFKRNYPNTYGAVQVAGEFAPWSVFGKATHGAVEPAPQRLLEKGTVQVDRTPQPITADHDILSQDTPKKRGALDIVNPKVALADSVARDIEGMSLTASPFEEFNLNDPGQTSPRVAASRRIILPGEPSRGAGGEVVGVEGYKPADVIPNDPILNDRQAATQETFLKGGRPLSREGIEEALQNQADPTLADKIATEREAAQERQRQAQLKEPTDGSNEGVNGGTEVAGNGQPGQQELSQVPVLNASGGESLPGVRNENVLSGVDKAAHEAAASPLNELPHPTEGQIEAGNYKKGHVKVNGFDISIENPTGSVRQGIDGNGKSWKTIMKNHYGYLKGTIGKDKDHVDVFLGPIPDTAEHVYVVDQINPKTGKLDEHKVMMGFASAEEARQGYLDNYDKSGKKRIGAITKATVPEFKAWLESGKTKKEFATGIVPVRQKLNREALKQGKTAALAAEEAARVIPAEDLAHLQVAHRDVSDAEYGKVVIDGHQANATYSNYGELAPYLADSGKTKAEAQAILKQAIESGKLPPAKNRAERRLVEDAIAHQKALEAEYLNRMQPEERAIHDELATDLDELGDIEIDQAAKDDLFNFFDEIGGEHGEESGTAEEATGIQGEGAGEIEGSAGRVQTEDSPGAATEAQANVGEVANDRQGEGPGSVVGAIGEGAEPGRSLLDGDGGAHPTSTGVESREPGAGREAAGKEAQAPGDEAAKVQAAETPAEVTTDKPIMDGDQAKLFATPPTFGKKPQGTGAVTEQPMLTEIKEREAEAGQNVIEFHAGLPVTAALKAIRNLPAVKPILDYVQRLVNLNSTMSEASRNALGKLRGTRNQANDLLIAEIKKANISATYKEALLKFATAEKGLREHFNRMPLSRRLEFFDKVRTGDVASMTPEEAKLYAIGEQLDAIFSDRIRQVIPDFPLREGHGMFTLKWDKDATGDAFPMVSARLEGDKSFVKKYSGKLATDIAANGLTLRESSPYNVLLKSWSDHMKFLSTAEFLAEAKETGRAEYATAGKGPEGMLPIPDAVGKVHKRILFPEEVKATEHIDKAMYDGLMQVAQQMGISPERVTNAGRGRLGYASPSGETVTQHGSETSVLAHEIGHQIDFQHDLWRRIVKEAQAEGAKGKVTKSASAAMRGTLQRELRAIADIAAQGRPTKYTRKKVEQVAQMVEAYVHAPDMMKDAAPNVYKAFTELIQATPELQGLDKIRPGIQLEAIKYGIKVPQPIVVKSFDVVDGAGNVIKQYPQRAMAETYLAQHGGDKVVISIGKAGTKEVGAWYLPEAEAVALKRYLEPDKFRNNPIVKGLLELKGIDTSLELLGFFHFANIGNEGIRAKSADAVRLALAGDVSGAKEAMNPRSGFGMMKLAEMATKDPAAFINDPAATAELQRAGMAPQQFVDIINEGYRAGLKMHNMSREIQGPVAKWYSDQAAKIPVLKTVQVAHDAVFSVTNVLFEKFVPDLKLSAYVHAMRTNERIYADRLASGELNREELARRTVNSIENRFGEINYENLILPKAFKTGLQLVFRAPGWNIGTWREIPNALRLQVKEVNRAIEKGEKPVLTMEMSWLMSTVALHVAESVVLGYAAAAFTGNEDLKPKAWVDYFFPKLSLLTRVTPPGYTKDIFSLAMDVRSAPFYLPMNFLQSKLAGIWGRLAEVYRNKDYYGRQVRNEEDSLPRQALDIAAHLAPKPIFVKSVMAQRSEGDDNPMVAATAVIGYPKAPSWVTKTRMEQYINSHMPKIDLGVSSDDADHKKAVSSLAHRFMTLQKANASVQPVIDEAKGMMQQGKLTERDLKKIDDMLSTPPLLRKFKMLQSFPVAIKAFNEMASDDERRIIAEEFAKKMDRFFEEKPDQAQKMLPKIQQSVEIYKRLINTAP